MTLADLQTKRDALISDIAAAKSEITKGDATIRWQLIDQMQTALSILDKEIAVASGTTNVRSVFVQHSRG